MKLRACRSNPRENTASDSNSAVISGSPCLARKFPRSGAGERETKGVGASYLLVRMRGSARVRATTAVCVCISARTRARLHIDEPTLSLSLSRAAHIWVGARTQPHCPQSAIHSRPT